MTHLPAFYETEYTAGWNIVCHRMTSNKEFKFFKKFYGIKNLRLTADLKLVKILEA